MSINNMTIMAQKVDLKQNWLRPRKNTNRETIHSGHFMISDFEAEAQDDEDELAVPVPDVSEPKAVIPCNKVLLPHLTNISERKCPDNRLAIETSLTKLFQCMSIAYRQKLTSPKWNRFKGVRLRWKDKIRLNNVIWRCWHMQFIKKKNTLVCQFASPLDVDTHNKPEAIVLEGKYWKRKLNAVTAEYKKWRMFTHNQILGRPEKYGHDLLAELENSEWQAQMSDSQMMVDEDYMNLMSDTLFSTISVNTPFHFPDSREIARGANLADFIQPSLVQLQPSLDEYMDIEPLHDLLCSKLATVQEEVTSSISSPIYAKTSSPLTGVPIQDKQQVLDQNFQQNSYPNTWYLPPMDFSQQSIYNPPPPPPPPQLPPQRTEETQVVSKHKSKHRSRSIPGINKKLVSSSNSSSLTNSDVNTGSLQSLPSIAQNQQQQGSALLQQLLSPSSSSLFSYIDSSGSSSPKLQSSHPQQQCVDVPVSYLSYQTVDNQTVYRSQSSDGSRINSIEQSKSYPLKSDNAINQSSNSLSDASPTTSLKSPVQQSPVHSLVNSPIGCPESPVGLQDPLSLSPLNPLSPSSPKYVPAYKEHRRVSHINAEQKRRFNIKIGFDTLHSLIPQLHQNPNAKMSKAAMLQKGADYIIQLRNERSSLKQEMDSLRKQIESLNNTICNCQSMLPVTGAPVSRHRSNKMKDMFKQYIKSRTIDNWKFWILSIISEPLLESFNNNVSTNSIEDLYQSTLQWVDQHCTLVDLRPVVLNALRQLCTSTEVLTDPARLPNEARAAVEKYFKKK